MKASFGTSFIGDADGLGDGTGVALGDGLGVGTGVALGVGIGEGLGVAFVLWVNLLQINFLPFFTHLN